MKIKCYLLYIIFFICISFSCSNNSIVPTTTIIRGIITMETSYSPSTFVDINTVQSSFKNNNLDFWIIGTNSSNKNMETFRENIHSIQKQLKNELFFNLPEINSSDTIYSSEIMLFNTNVGEKQPPVTLREIDSNILYETLHIKYNGEVTSFFDEYINLLDKGYILTPIQTGEIIGPEWLANTNFRINIKANKPDYDSIMSAISKRNLYISASNNINMKFQINGNDMGAIIEGFSELNAEYEISNQSTKIKAIEIVTNNNEIIFAQRNLDDNTVSRSIKLATNNDFAYFFLRCYFENGEIAFSTPIWTIRSRQIVINEISSTPIASKSSKYATAISFNLENISDNIINEVNYTILDPNNNIIEENQMMFKRREIVQFTKEFNFNTPIDNITIDISNKTYHQKQSIKLHNKKVAKIIFDASHNNIFAQDFKKVKTYLQQENHLVFSWDNTQLFSNYDSLSQNDILIITAPSRVNDLFEPDMMFMSRLNKYVYNGGILILVGYNSPDTGTPIIFMNECLRVVYSPMRFFVDNKYNLAPITDKISNFNDDEKIPVFTNFDKLNKFSNVKQIYFKNPIEFTASSGIGVTKVYGVKTLVKFNNTTAIWGKIPKYASNNSPAIMHKFGFGKVVILSGINFSDYDIDNLDNKQWFINLINYLIEKED